MYTKQTLKITSLLTDWAITIGLIVLGPFAIIITTSMFPGMESMNPLYAWALLPLGMGLFFMCAFCLGYLVPYLIFTAGMMGITAIALPNRTIPAWKRITLGLLAVGVGIFALASYRPAVSAADGYEVVVPTMPMLPLRGLKTAQSIGEIKPCIYELLGWEDETLYYTSACDDVETVWQISPNEASQPIPFEGVELPALSGEHIAHTEVLDRFQSYGVAPASAEYSVRSLMIQGMAIFSPDGVWLAVVSRHIYAAEDVLLVRSEQGS